MIRTHQVTWFWDRKQSYPMLFPVFSILETIRANTSHIREDHSAKQSPSFITSVSSSVNKCPCFTSCPFSDGLMVLLWFSPLGHLGISQSLHASLEEPPHCPENHQGLHSAEKPEVRTQTHFYVSILSCSKWAQAQPGIFPAICYYWKVKMAWCLLYASDSQ